MAYHINEEFSDILFDVINGNEVVMKVKAGAGGGGSGDVYVIKVNDSTAPSDSNVFSSLRVLSEIENNNEKLNDRYLRKDQEDTTLYPVDFQGGLLINSKRVSDIIRYYDEGDKVATDANVYSALMTDQRIEESLDGMDDRYLRKDREDTAHKHITFEEGITVYDLAKLMNLDVQELATIAQAVVKVLRSEKFVDGFAGEGYRIWQDIASGDWCFTIDRLTVRKVLTIYELVLQKIRSVGGMVVVSAANGKVKSAEKVGNSYVIEFEDTNMFVEHDLMRCQVFSAAGLKYYWVEISAVNGNQVIVPVSQFEGVVPAVGDECVLMGNTTDKLRQNLILISATEDGQPRFDCLDGVHSKSFEGCLKVRVGALSGISDSRFPADMQPQGYGLYGNNCYLTGIFVLANGKDVMTMFTIMEGMIKSEISSVRQEINEEDNYLSNASFSSNLQNWTGSNDIRIFRVSNRLLYFNSNFYANKEAFANIISTDEGRVLLRLKDSSITQKNSDFAMHPEFELVDITATGEDGTEEVIGQQYRPRMFFISFRYKVNRPGTLRVYFKGESGAGFEEYSHIDYTEDLQVTDEFKQIEIAGKWDGTGDFYLSFTGDMYLYSLALSDNALADLEEKFTLRFEMTDKKIQVNADEIKKTGEKLEEYHSEFLLTARELELRFTEDLQDMESSITAAYESYVSLTARDLTAQFTADITNMQEDITEAYKSYINLTAQSLRTEFTADITDMEEGITAAYESYVNLTAQGLEAGFQSDITDMRTGITQEYQSAITISASGLRTEFSESVDGVKQQYSSLSQTVDGITAQVNDVDGKYSSLKIQVDAIGAIVGDGTEGSFSEFQQTVDQLTTQVAENKTAANAALTAAQNAATEAANAYSKADQAYDKATDNATALVQTNASLSVIAGRFNADGTLKEGAGWVTTADANTLWVKKDGVISAINQTAESVTIDASRINLKGKVTISDLASGSGEGTIIEDGKIKADLLNTEHLVVTGSMRSPFTIAQDSINVDYSDNVVVISNGGTWIDAYSLPWDVNQSGRKICIVNYRWKDNIAEGWAGLVAPSGKYFYEDGTRKNELMMSRECVELLGYGDDSSFYGWIVLKRTYIMSEWQYGRPVRCLAMGVVIGRSTGVTSRCYTYNGDTISISRLGTGRYRVNLPSGWFSTIDDCFVIVSGYGAAEGYQLPAAPIKATFGNILPNSFDVYTSDDETVNDGGFTFMVYNLNDWS